MHPVEHLRYLARSSGIDDAALVAESAYALAAMPDDPAMLVVVCRRLIERHPTCAPLWWLCSQVLTSPRPSQAAWEAMSAIENDETFAHLDEAIPADRTVAVAGWSELVEVVARRPDLGVTDDVDDADMVIVEARAASSSMVLLDDADAELVDRVGCMSNPVAVEDADPAHIDAVSSPRESGVASPGSHSGERRHKLVLVCRLGTRLADAAVSEIARRAGSTQASSIRVVEPPTIFDDVVGPQGAVPCRGGAALRPDGAFAPELLLDTSGT